MILYVDTLVSFMPDSTVDNEGKLVKSDTLLAGRNAMIELSKYQQFHDTKALYSAINYACNYAHVDMIDTVVQTLNLDEPILFESKPGPTYVTSAALDLFQSVKPKVDFDVVKFVAYLLKAIHEDLSSARQQTTVNGTSDDR